MQLPRLSLSGERFIVGCSLYLTLAFNWPFLEGALKDRQWPGAQTFAFAIALIAMLVAMHAFLLGLVLHRRSAKWIVGLLLVTTAAAAYHMRRFGVYLDPAMLLNVLHTDWQEARDLLSPGLALYVLLFAGLPMLLLSRVELIKRPVRLASLRRSALLVLSLVTALGAVWCVFQDLSSLMRNQRELRYLITPENYLYSLMRAGLAGSAPVATQRTPVGADAHMGPRALARAKPALFVIVAGETARAANWGLNGYARQTTPQLALLDVLNFKDVSACGSDTETSLPCMFSAIGRRSYDERRIRSSESLLHVLVRAGYQVRWVDNQSGCKGVCDGIGEQRLCQTEPCHDESLVKALKTAAANSSGNLVLVLHMMGNHGPAYYKRYPPAMRRFTPTCDTAELHQCSREQIVNSYDNALLNTDDVLAQTVRFLQAQSDRFETGMVYVSDHGESLGEHGLFLHGLPYSIAPAEQTKVPMVWWLSQGLMASMGLDHGCLRLQTGRPHTHDNLFHTALGLLDVQTSAHENALDITMPCTLKHPGAQL